MQGTTKNIPGPWDPYSELYCQSSPLLCIPWLPLTSVSQVWISPLSRIPSLPALAGWEEGEERRGLVLPWHRRWERGGGWPGRAAQRAGPAGGRNTRDPRGRLPAKLGTFWGKFPQKYCPTWESKCENLDNFLESWYFLGHLVFLRGQSLELK